MEGLDQIIAFASHHRDEDPRRLLLQQGRYPEVDMRLVAQQIEGRRQAAAKWPSLAQCQHYFYPPRLNREQSSSEATARYKAALMAREGCHTFADLTGGMGVDTCFMAQHAVEGYYFEIDPALCHIARHNLAALGIGNVECHNTDSIAHLQSHPHTYDLLLVDPARRDAKGGRVYAFEDCTPPLLPHLPLLLSMCRCLLVKASPMLDLHQAWLQLGGVCPTHIVALHNECKEVLFMLDGQQHGGRPDPSEAEVHCVDLRADSRHTFSFTPQEEAAATPTYATKVGDYLYEPNVAIMKGGAYHLVGQRYGLEKLAPNTHLYTSNRRVEDFPGRTYAVLHELPLSARKIAPYLPEQKAHVVVRNYPVAAPLLQQRLRLSEGGTLYVVAATLGSNPMGWLCQAL